MFDFFCCSFFSQIAEMMTMYRYDAKVPKSFFVLNQDAWFRGIDMSMQTLGSAQEVTSDDMIRSQNAAIRKCWVVTGNHIRRAMFALSASTNIYPSELKDDSKCRKMMMDRKSIR